MDDGTEERWLPVVGWEDLYEVSDRGRVRSFRILKPRPTHEGRLRVGLYDGTGAQRDAYIQVLVAEAFLGPKPEGCETLHGPGGLTDNSVANLSYGTHIENCDDRARDGKYHFRLTQALAAEIRVKSANGATAQSLALEYGVGRSTIYRVLSGERWGTPGQRTRTPGQRTGHARGPNLAEAEIEEIRRAYEAGERVLMIAERAKVATATVYVLARREGWDRNARKPAPPAVA